MAFITTKNISSRKTTYKPQYLYRYGCNACGYKKAGLKARLTQKEFIDKVQKKYKEYDFKDTIYKSYKEKVKVKCKKCGKTFEVTPISLICNYKICPNRCNSKLVYKSYSKISLECINRLSQISDIDIQTAVNDGEKYISTKKGNYYIDGFIKELNLGIEFNGTYWHRDKRKFGINKRYLSTIKKAKNLRSKIYLFSIWEEDWRKNQIKIEKKFLKIIDMLKKHKERYTISVDPGLKNTGIIVMDYKNKKIIDAFVTDLSVKNLTKKPDDDGLLFKDYFNGFSRLWNYLIQLYCPSKFIIERYQNRGMRRGNPGEVISFGIGVISEIIRKLNKNIGNSNFSKIELLTASTWKNYVNKKFSLETLYSYGSSKNIPEHLIDALCTNLFINKDSFNYKEVCLWVDKLQEFYKGNKLYYFIS